MKIIKVLSGLVVFGLALFLFVANFSTSETRYECNGKIIDAGAEQPGKIYFKLQRYRWWVNLWSDSSGMAWIEVPNKQVFLYHKVDLHGDRLAFSTLDTPGKLSDLGGVYSTLSNALSTSLGTLGVFEGTCVALEAKKVD